MAPWTKTNVAKLPPPDPSSTSTRNKHWQRHHTGRGAGLGDLTESAFPGAPHPRVPGVPSRARKIRRYVRPVSLRRSSAEARILGRSDARSGLRPVTEHIDR